MTRALKSSGEINFGVVILAAGQSSRMGQPKLLLPWRETSVLGHLIHSWTGLGAGQIAVVCAGNAPEIHAELDRLQFAREDRIMNPLPEAGMFSSIQCAAKWPNWRTSLTHFVIVLGDQPHLHKRTLGLLLDFAAANSQRICQPLWGGRRCHPVVLPRDAFTKLAELTAGDLKQFLNSKADMLAGLEMDDPGLDLDMDSPLDYERIRKLPDLR